MPEKKMQTKADLPNQFQCNGLSIKKISNKRDTKLLEELIVLYKKNRKHLLFWHRNETGLIFKNTEDYIKYLVKSRLVCYVVRSCKKIIGCIEISHIIVDDDSCKYRFITYWIDKNHKRMGIMFDALSIIENIFGIQQLDYIMAAVHSKNEPSIKLLDKLHYTIDYKYSYMSSNSNEISDGPFIRFRKNMLEHSVLEDKIYRNKSKKISSRINYCRKHKLGKLDISYFNIDKLPKEISELYWLKELNLSYNDLKQLPEWLMDLSELEILNLNCNKLVTLPESINKLKNLKKISLDYNDIQTLPNSFGDLPLLEEFISNGSELIELPESFCKLKSLRSLCISLPISLDKTVNFSFPNSLENLKSLRDITLNRFDIIPNFVGELKDLISLDISGNDIKILPDFIKNLTNLRKLNLHYLCISELPSWIATLKELEILDISSNHLEKYPEIIRELPKLKEFDDSFNLYNSDEPLLGEFSGFIM
jgi:Leucine-rich repeat (LRR) protein